MNKKKKILVCANFGSSKQTSSGQIIKSQILKDELIRIYGESQVSVHNTASGLKSLFLLILKLLGYLNNHSNIIILPAHNGLKIIAPLVFLANAFYKRNLSYVVIGGWLPSFLQRRPFLRSILCKYKGIYVETNMMKKALSEIGFSNVYVMPNFKTLTAVNEKELKFSNEAPIKLCTFSRVMREKGIEDAVRAVKELNADIESSPFELHIYGNIEEEQIDWFNDIVSQFPDYIIYEGSVTFSESVNTLKNYFALLFPTYYEGEGVAGTLIDAMAAGIPSVASDWRYNSEIIKDGVTGLLHKTHDVKDLKSKILSIYENKELYRKMKISSLNEFKRYCPSEVVPILTSHLD